MAEALRGSGERATRVGAGYALALLAVLALAGWLRMHDLRSGLWLDELVTSVVVADGFAEIPERSHLANVSPLYFGLVRASTAVVGFNESGIRLPSVLGGLALVLLVPGWLRSRGVAPGSCLACAALVALDPALLDPATWAKPTSLVIAVSLVATLVFERIVIAGSTRLSDRAQFVAAHVIAFYLHYMALGLLLWQLLYAALLWIRERDLRFSPRRLALDCLWVCLLCLPAAPHLLELARGRAGLEYTHAALLAGELDRYFAVEILAMPLFAAWCLAFALGQPRLLRESALRERLPQLNLFAFLYVAPIVAFWALSKANLAELTIYSRYCSVLPILALGLLLDAIDRRGPRMLCIATGCLLLAFGEESPGRKFLDDRRFADPYQEWKQAVAALRSEGTAGDVVFVDVGLAEQAQLGADSPEVLRRYLLSPVAGLYSLAGSGMELRAISPKFVPTDPATLAALRGAARVFVLAPAGRPDSARRVVDALAKAGLHLAPTGVRPFRGVTVSLLAGPSDRTGGAADAPD